MATGTKSRRLVDAVDDLRAEIRTANLLTVLTAGVAVLEHDDGKRATSDKARARVEERNGMRAEVRRALAIGEEQGQ